MFRNAIVAVALLGAVACNKTDAPKGTAAPKDLEARLAKLEKRMDTVVSILEQALPPNEPDPAKTYSVPVNPIDPVEGPADAKVTIVEGFEFLCPYCWKVNPTVEQLQAAYPKDVRVVAKYIVIHGAPALPPGMLACAAAKQGKYPEVKKALWAKLFDASGQVQRDQLEPANLDKLITETGLDVAKTKALMDSDECKGWVKSSQDSLQPVGTTGTPSFYINGRHIGGAVPLEEFKKIVDEELAKANKAIEGGVKVADYYQKNVVEKGEKKVKGRFED
jgi:protein-disulfide isomerase